jgi:GNAT superfamily N-acetyltransferase
MEWLRYALDAPLKEHDITPLYKLNRWPAGWKPDALLGALHHADHVVTAWNYTQLIGLGSAISDGHLVVYYPHLLVLPSYQGNGIGTAIMERLQAQYEGFHQQVLLAQDHAVGFYEKRGFQHAHGTTPMWIHHEG